MTTTTNTTPTFSMDPSEVPMTAYGYMPDSGTPMVKPAPLSSITASASRLTSKEIKKRQMAGRGRTTGSNDWQAEAWDMYDLVGEQRFLAATLAGRMGQARLYVGKMEKDDTAEPGKIEDESIKGILDSVGGNAAGRSQLIRRLGMNLFIAGEGWLVGIPKALLPEYEGQGYALPTEAEGEALSIDVNDLEWRVFSIDEVAVDQQGLANISIDDSTKISVSPDLLYLIRVWRPHPRKAWQADSPTRASLPILRELVGLTMHISAQVDSRLAGAGVLVVPQSASDAMRRSQGLPTGGVGSDDEADPFTDALIDAMLTPISDRGNASALVPLVITVPDESAGKFEHITFAQPLDNEARSLREEAIRRLALGQDAPPELLLGVGGMNHWGAWLVREDVVTTHIEPPLALICDALTTQFLHPLLIAEGYTPEEAAEYVIWYDVSHMIVRPNRGSDAMALFDKGALSAEALRTATGFDEGDAPTVTKIVDPAVTMALEMVKNAPSLAQAPGIAALVEQIRAVLNGDDLADVQGNVEAVEEETPETTEGDIPATSDDDSNVNDDMTASAGRN